MPVLLSSPHLMSGAPETPGANIAKLAEEIIACEAEIRHAAQKAEMAMDTGNDKMFDYWAKEKEQLRKKEEQLRKEKEQLRKKEEQLREMSIDRLVMRSSTCPYHPSPISMSSHVRECSCLHGLNSNCVRDPSLRHSMFLLFAVHFARSRILSQLFPTKPNAFPRDRVHRFLLQKVVYRLRMKIWNSREFRGVRREVYQLLAQSGACYPLSHGDGIQYEGKTLCIQVSEA